MSDTEPIVARGAYAGLPFLTEDNFADWDMQIIAYLTGTHDHSRVITPVRQKDSTFKDPTPPDEADSTATAEERKAAAEEIANWHKSERVVTGCLMATAGKLHREAVLKHRQTSAPVYQLWTKICEYHQQRDASQRHEAWMEFLAIRMAPSKAPTSVYQRINEGYDKIERITPPKQTPEERGQELRLFTLLSAFPPDHPLRMSLITQEGLTLAGAGAALLRWETTRKIADSDEQAHAAFGGCFLCGEKDHIQRDCPHREAAQQFVTKRKNGGNGSGSSNGNGNGGWRSRKGRGNATTFNASAANTNVTNVNSANKAHETAGVATLLLSNESRVADVWLCDSGASSSMSGNRSAFRSLTEDRRPIRLADGKVIYSRGLGTIDFLSDLGYTISIDNVLFVPDLSVNLFSANKFAKERRYTHSETTEYPKRKWINRHTGAVEFTATIRPNDLAYLDWKVASRIESVNISMEELHARLNHLPFRAVRRLVRTGSVNGIPKQVTGTQHPNNDFCEDCVNGKLTRAPHTLPATRAEAPLQRVYTDVHGPVPTRSRRGHIYWVSFVDDYSRFPAVYFITEKSDVYDAFKRYKAWAENITGRRIGILRDDKGGEYVSSDLDRYLADAGIRREHSIRDTPQQLGVAERLNRTLAEGITTALSQSGLTRTWWEDAAAHFLSGKIRLPSSVTNRSPYELFYGKKPSVGHLRPFGCLAYVHLQKDQHGALLPHAAQCIFVGYPIDYKGWRFYNPATRKEIISDSAVFRESVFPFRKPGLSAIDRSTDSSPPTEATVPTPSAAPDALSVPRPLDDLAPEPMNATPPRLVPYPQLLGSPPPAPPADLPEQPHPPPEIRNLTSHFEHHPANEQLPPKRASRARRPGALAEHAEHAESAEVDIVPVLAAMDYALATVGTTEPRTLAEAMTRPDAAKWLEAAYAELQAHVTNGTWELAQLPPGKRAIGSRWVFKVKRKPDGSIDKYKGRVVAQGYSQIAGIHYGEVFASTARMAAMRAVIAQAAIEDMELETVDISTAFLNGDIDREIYMKIPEGLEVDGEPAPGEDPKKWVLRLLKGLYGIKQGPRIWALKLHSVLSEIGFERTDCDYSVYIYRRDDVKVILPIHVDDLLIASNSRDAIQKVKSDLAARFKIHDQGPATSILGIKIERDRPN